MEQRYIFPLYVISAIMIHANAIKLQSWGNITNWKWKASKSTPDDCYQAEMQTCSCFREAKTLDCNGQFSNFQSLGQIFCLMVGRVRKTHCMLGFANSLLVFNYCLERDILDNATLLWVSCVHSHHSTIVHAASFALNVFPNTFLTNELLVLLKIQLNYYLLCEICLINSSLWMSCICFHH